MAVLHPDWSVINKAHQPPTEGEITFLKFLQENLNDQYEIFFQPYLNGDRPDIILLKKGGGALIIEVKDFNLDLYRVNENTKWEVKTSKGNWHQIYSPFNQVFNYKKNLFELHSKELITGKIKDSKIFGVVNCAVFFSKGTMEQFNRIVKKPFQNNKEYDKYLKFLSYFEVYTVDTLTKQKLYGNLSRTWISKGSNFFEDKYYKSFKRYLKPPYHYESEGIDITYTKEQKTLVPSVAGKRQKIKGVAGCGKTIVLAKRAVNAHKRTNEPVLILTYNLSLVNYIKDRIYDVKEDFPRTAFHIINYHQFFKAEARNNGLELTNLQCWDNPRFFELAKEEIKTYSAVFIDEVQDYTTNWLDLINTYFVRKGGEFVILGDEKQNIYDRPLDEEKNITTKGISGGWNNSLKTCIRFTENIAKLAAGFQLKFLGKKYNLESIKVINQKELGILDPLGKGSKIDYFKVDNLKTNTFYEIIKKYIIDNDIHSSDVAVICSTIHLIRELDYLVRTDMNEKTTVTFEKKEFYDSLIEPSNSELERFRRAKKLHFYMKTGTMKLSTIHSFKGWDIPTLFLLIDETQTDEYGFTSHEMIYTALTRARQNLVIINAVSEKYHQFFATQI